MNPLPASQQLQDAEFNCYLIALAPKTLEITREGFADVVFYVDTASGSFVHTVVFDPERNPSTLPPYGVQRYVNVQRQWIEFYSPTVGYYVLSEANPQLFSQMVRLSLAYTAATTASVSLIPPGVVLSLPYDQRRTKPSIQATAPQRQDTRTVPNEVSTLINNTERYHITRNAYGQHIQATTRIASLLMLDPLFVEDLRVHFKYLTRKYVEERIAYLRLLKTARMTETNGMVSQQAIIRWTQRKQDYLTWKSSLRALVDFASRYERAGTGPVHDAFLAALQAWRQNETQYDREMEVDRQIRKQYTGQK